MKTLYSAMSLLPHAYHILFFMTSAWKAALCMQIVGEMGICYFFLLYHRQDCRIPKMYVHSLVEQLKR